MSPSLSNKRFLAQAFLRLVAALVLRSETSEGSAAIMSSCPECIVPTANVEGKLKTQEKELMSRSIPGNERCKALPILVSLGLLALPSVARATDFAWKSSDSAEFKSYCVDYYSPTQCDDALRFILKTYGLRYIVALHMNEDPQSYLVSLHMVIEAGEQMKVSVGRRIDAHD